jgi:hypothetical protein
LLAPLLEGILDELRGLRSDPEGFATRGGFVIGLVAFILTAVPTAVLTGFMGYWTFWMFVWAGSDHEERIQTTLAHARVDAHDVYGLTLCEDGPRREQFLGSLARPPSVAVGACRARGRLPRNSSNRPAFPFIDVPDSGGVDQDLKP